MRIAVIACWALALGAAPAGAVSGSLGVRLIDVPAAAQLDPRARLYIVDHLAPGSVIRRRIQISNTTTTSLPVVVYPAAASIAKGTFRGAAGHARNDVSSWTTVQPGAMSVRAGGHRTAAVSISVPDDAAPGEHYAVVWAETRSKNGPGITQVNRVGVRVYLSVGPGGPPAANFSIDKIAARRDAGGAPSVVAEVHNTGGRALDMHGTLKLRDGPGGLTAGPYAATPGVTLAVGDTAPVIIALDRRLPDGPWDAQVKLRSGLLVRSTRSTITFPAAEPVEADSSKSRLPYILVGAFGLVLVAAALSRRRRHGPTFAADHAGGA